jgi:3-hydroxyisobutyrate dehydrogenase
VLATGISAGYDRLDDAQLTRVYLPSTPTLVLDLASQNTSSSELSSEETTKLKLVEIIMKGVHLVSAMEAMSLGKTVGLETQQLFEIIKGAAGSSWMFADRTPQLLSGKWTSKETVNDVIDSLVSYSLPVC